MRYLFLLFTCLFVLQSCDTTEPPKEEVIPSPELLSPSDDSSGVMVAPTLTWKAVTGATSYLVQISKGSDFAVVIDSATVNVTAYQMEGLDENETYYWHVRAMKQGTTSEWSVTYSFNTGAFNARIAVGTRLLFESIDMETQEKDTIHMHIAEQGLTFGGKTNVVRVSVTVQGVTNDIFMNYEPNGNFSVQDAEWVELPVGTKQGQDYGLDTIDVTDETIVVEHRTTKYEGSATVIIQGVSYPFEMASFQRESMYFDATTGELKDVSTRRIIFSFSPKLGFLTGVEEYFVDSSESMFTKTSLYEISN